MTMPNDDLKPTSDQAAAQQFLTELRTRISTKPLPYQFDVEESAAEAHPFAGNEWRPTAPDKTTANIYEVSPSSPLVMIKLGPSGGPNNYGITGILGNQLKCCRNPDATRFAP
jgi:hypothetical protein